MPIPFEQFRLLNGSTKKVENVSYQRDLHVRVDEHPIIIVPPGETRDIPEGQVVEVLAEAAP